VPVEGGEGEVYVAGHPLVDDFLELWWPSSSAVSAAGG
jgi:hypothetical protein